VSSAELELAKEVEREGGAKELKNDHFLIPISL